MKKLFLLLLSCILLSCLVSAGWTANLDTDLAAYWNFNEGAGTHLTDSLGIKNGTLIDTNSSAWKAGKVGNAMDFDGIDDYVNLSVIPTTETNLTISAWVYLTSHEYGMIVSYGADTNIYKSLFLYTYTDGTLRFDIRNVPIMTSAAILPLDTWVHVAITANETGNVAPSARQARYIMYINGSVTATGGEIPMNITDTMPYHIGSNSISGINNFSGRIDEMGIWNRALNTSEISQLYNDGIGISYGDIDDCSSNPTMILNLTLKDEDNQNKINLTMQNGSIALDLSIYYTDGTPYRNFSTTFNTTNPVQICIPDALTTNYQIDMEAKYSATNYASEFYHLQNSTLNNLTAPFNIDLYDLLDSRSQEFVITFKDESFLPVENALIDITRKYTGEGVFKTIEIGRTDENGQTIGHFVVAEEIYTIIVTKYGQTLATFDNVMAICEDVLAEECNINLNAFTTGVPTEDFDTYKNLDYTTTFNQLTRTITTIFNVVDGSTARVDLNTTKYDRFGNLSVCDDSILASSGTLTCVVPASFGNLTIISELSINGELVTTYVYNIAENLRDYFGGSQMVMVLIMVIIIPLMFITSPIGIIIGVIISIIMAGLLILSTGGSFIGIGATFLWLIVAGGIIIWRIAKKD